MSGLLNRLRQRSGQVALEVFAVAAAWIFVVILFFNIMLVVSSMMLVQANVNRITVQTGALGCFPAEQFQDDLSNTLNQFGVFGSLASGEYDLRVRQWPAKSEGSSLLTSTPVGATDVPPCQVRNPGSIGTGERYASSGAYISVELRYQQRIVFFLPDQEVLRTASTISSRLEPEG
jgi:hypothetical protein